MARRQSGTWQSATTGTRGLVRAEALRLLRQHGHGECPECGAPVEHGREGDHAEGCGDLRAEAASRV